MIKPLLIILLTWFGTVNAQPSSGSSEQTIRLKAENAYAAGKYQEAANTFAILAIRSDQAAKQQIGKMIFEGKIERVDYHFAYLHYKVKADRNELSAINWVGIFAMLGYPGVPVDYHQSYTYFSRAVARGDINAINNIAEYCSELNVGEAARDYLHTAELYKTAAVAGNLTALANLANMYADPAQLVYDPAKALEIWKEGISKGSISCAEMFRRYSLSVDPEYSRNAYEKLLLQCHRIIPAELTLAEFYLEPESNEASRKKGLEILKSLANKENSEAMYLLGKLYLQGNQVSENTTLGLNYLHRSALSGLSRADLFLYNVYNNGLYNQTTDRVIADKYINIMLGLNTADNMVTMGYLLMSGNEEIEKDMKLSLMLLEKAANLNHTKALINLGNIYIEGAAVLKDPEKALTAYSKAASLGDAEGYYNLGLSYARGEGLPKPDFVKSREYYQQGIDRGSNNSACNLGNMYINGIYGTTKNIPKAISYFEKAASWGDVGSLNDLGLIYGNSQYVIYDKKKSINYFTKACVAHMQEACDTLNKLH